jgi:hypothetical protein
MKKTHYFVITTERNQGKPIDYSINGVEGESEKDLIARVAKSLSLDTSCVTYLGDSHEEGEVC